MSSASSSTSTLTPAMDSRPEAEPLPSKVGEIGYTAPKSPEIRQLSTNSTPSSPLPARHPADRDDEPASSAPTTSPTTPANTMSSASKKSWRNRLSVGGVSPVSIFRILLLLMLMGGTGAAWAITILKFSPQAMGYASSLSPVDSQVPTGDGANAGNPDNNINSNNSNSNNDTATGIPALSSVVIVHVSFTIVALVQLLFLERSIFHARAERYLYKHGMPRSASGASMGFAPWNRPSLPTYAAALTESGVGTGDVEDNLIAIPPPPAYGNTRGSRLLLSGMLRESLIRQLNRSSQRSSTTSTLSPASPREMEEGRRSRPLSYDASEEVDNAKRAMDLEVALAKLEHGRD